MKPPPGIPRQKRPRHYRFLLDPAPPWVPRLAQFLSAMLIGGVIGFGFGLAAR